MHKNDRNKRVLNWLNSFVRIGNMLFCSLFHCFACVVSPRISFQASNKSNAIKCVGHQTLKVNLNTIKMPNYGIS